MHTVFYVVVLLNMTNKHGREYSSKVNCTLINVHTVHDLTFQFTIFYSSQLLNSIEKMKSSAGRIPPVLLPLFPECTKNTPSSITYLLFCVHVHFQFEIGVESDSSSDYSINKFLKKLKL